MNTRTGPALNTTQLGIVAKCIDEPLTVPELAARLHRTKQAIYAALPPLLAHGLVRRLETPVQLGRGRPQRVYCGRRSRVMS